MKPFCQEANQPFPTMMGRAGRAWLLDLDDALARHGASIASLGLVAMWVVEAPWVRAEWRGFSLILTHLRDVPGVPPAQIDLAGATHELSVSVLDPAHALGPQIASGSLETLVPPVFGRQFIAASDAEAAEWVRDAVRDICVGRLCPDYPNRADWEARFGKVVTLEATDDTA